MSPYGLLQLFERAADAPQAVPRLRRLVLDLALHGKLVRQDAQDEPASQLLRRIAEEQANSQMSASKTRKLALAIDRNELPFSYPESWEVVRLRTICSRIHYGYTASADLTSKEVRLLRITDIQDNKVDWDSVPGCVIDPDDVDHYRLKRGDILVARTGGTVGKTFLVRDVPVTAVFASYLIRIQCSEHILDDYLKLFFESSTYWEQLRDGTRGTGQPNVNGETLGMLVLPIPPFREQCRIVDKTMELMALCDRLDEANAQREGIRDRFTAASYSRLRSSVADDASTVSAMVDALEVLTARADQVSELRDILINLGVRGKLTQQDPMDKSAAEIVAGISAQRRLRPSEGKSRKGGLMPIALEAEPFAPPPGWVWTTLGEIGEWGSGSTPLRSRPELYGGGITWLKSGELNDSRNLVGSEETITDIALQSGTFRQNRPGDVLIAMYGATIGRVAILGESAVTNQAVCGCTPFDGVFNEFLYYFLLSRRHDFRGASEGGAQPNISKVKIVRTPFLLPPLAEQHRIVAKLDDLMELCDKLGSHLSVCGSVRSKFLDSLIAEALLPLAAEDLRFATA